MFQGSGNDVYTIAIGVSRRYVGDQLSPRPPSRVKLPRAARDLRAGADGAGACLLSTSSQRAAAADDDFGGGSDYA